MEKPPPRPSPSLNSKLEPGTRIGHYVVEELISSGGFGAVYRVTRDGKQFALKVPLTGASELSAEERRTSETRILREVGALMSLKHPGIVGVHGYDRFPDPVTGALYLVMDFVDGQPMTKWRENSACTLREMIGAFRLLALAVHEMHQMGVVHRDIKSSNVLVVTNAESDGHGQGSSARSLPQSEARPGASATSQYQPVLVDFGLARPTFTPNVTAEHVLVGTEGRWAPELVATSGPHIQHTPATDLYALGHLIFEVLTGRASPYSRKSSRLLRPSEVAPGLLPALDSVVTRLLAANPAERTPSALVLAQQLESILTDASWGDFAALPASRTQLGGLDLAGRFGLTRDEGIPERLPTTSVNTVVCAERPTVPLFVLDPIERPDVASPPGTPYPRTPPPQSRWRKAARYALLGFDCALVVFMAVVCFFVGSAVEYKLRRVVSAQPNEPAVGGHGTGARSVEPVQPSFDAGTGEAARARARTAPLRSAGRSPPPTQTLVRAALVGHATTGATRAVLRQPVQLATATLPTGATLDGNADELPDGRFLLRFGSVKRPDGSVLELDATALVDASAAARRPLIPGAASSGFEFDLTLATSHLARINPENP